MDDLISRQAAVYAIDEMSYAFNVKTNAHMAFIKALADLPSAERRGRWEDVEHAPNGLLYATCSVCGKRQTIEATGYCGNCGAKMDEKEDPDIPQEAYYNKGLLRWKMKDEVEE